MLAAMNIVVIPGSNRQGALSARLADIVAGHHRDAGRDVDLLDPKEMGAEFLAPTAYKQQTPAIHALVDRFLASDGVHFVIPEYNGSFPGVLKLLIDMLPFPAGLDKRPCAFIGLAAGQFQGLRAVEQFQMVCGYRNAYQFPRRVFIGSSYQQFTDTGLADQDLADRVKAQCDDFAAFVDAVGGKQAKARET